MTKRRLPGQPSGWTPPSRPRPAKGAGGEQIEGRRAVRELLVAGRRGTREIFLATGQDGSPVLTEILELARQARVPVRHLAPLELAHLATTEVPQGVIARAEPLPAVTLDDLTSPRADGTAPFLVALDGVTDPHNLGSILRSALAAGATGAVLASHGAATVTPSAAKAAAGAIEYLPIAMVPGIASALERFRRAGVWCVGLDAEGTDPLSGLGLVASPVALVLGAEGSGLGQLSRRRCDVLARIDMYGPLDSLSVSAAAAVACFAVASRRANAARLSH